MIKSPWRKKTLFDDEEILPRTKAICNAGFMNKSKVFAIK